jgi:hypothetical protein
MSTQNAVWQESISLRYTTNIAPAFILLPDRRLEDKIRHLCALAIVAKDDDAWLILSELRLLLRQHVEHLRMVAAGKLAGVREFLERRRTL